MFLLRPAVVSSSRRMFPCQIAAMKISIFIPPGFVFLPDHHYFLADVGSVTSVFPPALHAERLPPPRDDDEAPHRDNDIHERLSNGCPPDLIPPWERGRRQQHCCTQTSDRQQTQRHKETESRAWQEEAQTRLQVDTWERFYRKSTHKRTDNNVLWVKAAF